MTLRGQLVGFVLGIIWLNADPVSAGEPLELIRATTDSVIAVLREAKQKGPDRKPERIERVKRIVTPVFDYDEMARLTLAPHWERQSPAEQVEFVKLLRGFLERVYSDRIDDYHDERVVLGKETIDHDFAVVESKLIDPKGEESVVNYRLRLVDGKWKIYDAVVEDISLVTNYRSQFNRVISKSSLDGLKKMLRERAN